MNDSTGKGAAQSQQRGRVPKGEISPLGYPRRRGQPAEGLGIIGSVTRHFGLVAMVTAAWCLAGGIYLRFAPSAYTATAKLSTDPTCPRILSDNDRPPVRPPSYTAQQCEVIKSAPILQDAVARLETDDQATLSGAGDPVAFLKRNLHASVSKKDEVITIRYESPDPACGARIVDQVVGAYLEHRSKQQQAISREVLRLLQEESDRRQAELAAKQNAVMEFGRSSGLCLTGEKTDATTQRLGRLFEALTEAQLDTLAAQANHKAVEAMVNDPVKLGLFAESQGILDRQWLSDASRSQLLAERSRLEAKLASLRQELTDEHPSVRGLQAQSDALNAELGRQNESLASRCTSAALYKLQAAQSREASIRQSIQEQQRLSQQSNADLAKYAMLQTDLHQTERLCDVIKTRIAETRAADQAGALDVRIVEPAYAAPIPTSPNPATALALPGGIGLMVGTLLALRRDRRRGLQPRQSALGDARHVQPSGQKSIRVIVRIPPVSDPAARQALAHCVSLMPASPLAGAFRSIATDLYFRCGSARSLMVTSLQRGGGTTTLVANLAQILAQSGKKTVVVDAAFNHPSLHDVFGVDPGGLAEVFAGEATLEQAVSPTSVNGLHLLPAGLAGSTGVSPVGTAETAVLPNGAAAGEFEDQFLRRIIRTLSESYDIVLVDSPPAACWTRPDVMSGLCDATILLAGAAQARDGTLWRAAAALKKFGANVVGAVIAHAPADVAEPGINDEVPASSGSESAH